MDRAEFIRTKGNFSDNNKLAPINRSFQMFTERQASLSFSHLEQNILNKYKVFSGNFRKEMT